MAIVKIQAPLAGIRGKYGGMVFSGNGSGNYVRQWNYPVDPCSVGQVQKRSWLARIRHGWGELSAGQIAVWDALAASPPEVDYNSLGEVILLSGSAWHTRCNLRRLERGLAYEDDAPSNVSVNAPVTFGLTVYEYAYAGRADLLTYTNGDFTGFGGVLKIAVSSSISRAGMSTGHRVIGIGAIPTNSPLDITTALADVVGWLAVGNRLYGKLWKESVGGIRSVPLEVVVDVLPEP